ncbi:MAG: hypothetical protein J0I93_08665 [Legionella sp.]|nr:hypothetical protein [Legionella sp.]
MKSFVLTSHSAVMASKSTRARAGPSTTRATQTQRPPPQRTRHATRLYILQNQPTT